MRSYLKFLSRNKLYTAIEAAGLAVSLAFVILIGSYVAQQYSVARENPDWERIYVPGSNSFIGLTFWDKEEIDMSVPEVEASARFAFLRSSVMELEGEKYQGISGFGMMTDPEFFDIFPYYEIREGSVGDFKAKDAVFLTERMARMILDRTGNGESLVGKSLVIGGDTYRIVGVIQNLDDTLFNGFDLVGNIASSFMATMPKRFNSLGYCSTMYRVRADVSREEADAKVMEVIRKNYEPNWGEQLKDWHTYRMDELFWGEIGNGMMKKGNRQMTRILTIVVLLLLLSAVLNYVNLSFALSGRRAREMATRRLIGAGKGDILRKNVLESVLFTAACFAVALVLAKLLVPMMNGLLSTQEEQGSLFNTDVQLRFRITPAYICAYLAGTVILGVLCGIFPAISASRTEPIDVIKGAVRRRSRMVFGKVFIIVQNALSVFLIAMAIVMEVQMKHMIDRPTNSLVGNRFSISFFASNFDDMKLFKDKVDRLPFVTASGVGRGFPGSLAMTIGTNLDDGTHFSLPVIICDTTYFDLLGLEVVEDFGHPRVHSLWMDESAFLASGVSDTSSVFARKFNANGATAEYIGGVVRDFPMRSASYGEDEEPYAGVIVSDVNDFMYVDDLFIGTIGEDKDYERQILEAYREYRMEKFGAYEEPWRYGFLKNIYRMQLEPAKRTMRLLELFMCLSVLISLLGLLAMSTYYSDENTKQIAIRKVFGGDVTGEIWRNVKSYMVLAAVACIIGIPVAVWGAGQYLQRFAYRISGYGWAFAAAAVITLAIAFLSVLWQTLKAARTNPAEELKKE